MCKSFIYSERIIGRHLPFLLLLLSKIIVANINLAGTEAIADAPNQAMH